MSFLPLSDLYPHQSYPPPMNIIQENFSIADEYIDIEALLESLNFFDFSSESTSLSDSFDLDEFLQEWEKGEYSKNVFQCSMADLNPREEKDMQLLVDSAILDLQSSISEKRSAFPQEIEERTFTIKRDWGFILNERGRLKKLLNQLAVMNKIVEQLEWVDDESKLQKELSESVYENPLITSMIERFDEATTAEEKNQIVAETLDLFAFCIESIQELLAEEKFQNVEGGRVNLGHREMSLDQQQARARETQKETLILSLAIEDLNYDFRVVRRMKTATTYGESFETFKKDLECIIEEIRSPNFDPFNRDQKFNDDYKKLVEAIEAARK